MTKLESNAWANSQGCSLADYDRPGIYDVQILMGNGIGGRNSEAIIRFGNVGLSESFVYSIGERRSPEKITVIHLQILLILIWVQMGFRS